ncbi:MAG: hypothetical protein AAGF28_09435 [Pseudomonadota bacterium]
MDALTEGVFFPILMRAVGQELNKFAVLSGEALHLICETRL